MHQTFNDNSKQQVSGNVERPERPIFLSSLHDMGSTQFGNMSHPEFFLVRKNSVVPP
jgi:hypothetical protein